MFTLYRIVKQSVAKCISDSGSLRTGNASSGTIFAPEQDCTAPLLKVERPISDRLFIPSGLSMNTFVRAEIAQVIGKFEAKTVGFRLDLDRIGAV